VVLVGMNGPNVMDLVLMGGPSEVAIHDWTE
jgi:hypothetical protein